MSGETKIGQVGEFLGFTIAKGAVWNAVGGAAAGMSGIFSVIGVSVAATASIIIKQIDYQNKRSALREMYKDEVAAQLGKSPEEITNKDLTLVARGDPRRGIAPNKVINEELDKLKSHRNLGILVTAMSILGTVAIMGFVFGTGGAAVGVGAMAAQAFVGFATHKLLDIPLTWAGKKMFGIKDLTTQERIEELNNERQNGKVLGREQVLGVFISANKELSRFVKSHYSNPYDKLSVQEKRELADAFEQYIPLANITESLNSGKVKVSELAFSVEGRASGVAPSSVPPSLSIVGKVRTALRGIGERLRPAVQKPEEEPVTVTPKRAVVEYDNPVPSRSFVERYEAEKGVAKYR